MQAGMAESIDDVTREWLLLLNQKEDARALELFCLRIIPLLVDRLHARFRVDHPSRIQGGRYRGLISLLGYTPDTVVLAARFTTPLSMVVLHTPETAPFLAPVRLYCGVPETALRTIAFDKSNIDSLRHAFAEAAASLDGDVAVELTGGTKLMGAVLHLAAAIRGLDTLYIDYGEYDPRHRKPLPASTYIRLVDSAPWMGLTSTRSLPAALDSCRASIGAALDRLEHGPLPADEIRTLLESILAALDRAR